MLCNNLQGPCHPTILPQPDGACDALQADTAADGTHSDGGCGTAAGPGTHHLQVQPTRCARCRFEFDCQLLSSVLVLVCLLIRDALGYGHNTCRCNQPGEHWTACVHVVHTCATACCYPCMLPAAKFADSQTQVCCCSLSKTGAPFMPPTA
jgi:hypothetical protein